MQRLPRISFLENQIRFFRQAGFVERDFPREWHRLVLGTTSDAEKMALVSRIKMGLVDRFEADGLSVVSVRYEDLVSKPREILAVVTRHIGIPMDEQCLEPGQAFHGIGPGGTDRSRAIGIGSLSSWREHLSPETEDSIWNAVGEFYEELGYSRNPPRQRHRR